MLRDGGSLSRDGELTEDHRAALDTVLSVAARTGCVPLALDAMAMLAGIAHCTGQSSGSAADGGRSVLAARVRGLQDGIKALDAADSALLKALAADRGVPAARAARAALADQVAAERMGIARDYPRWVEVQGGERPDLSTLRAALAPDEALLAVMPAFDGVYLLAVGADGARRSSGADGPGRVGRAGRSAARVDDARGFRTGPPPMTSMLSYSRRA